MGFPQCGGSIDGSRILVTTPVMNHTDYYNRKGFYSVILQSVVDHNNLFSLKVRNNELLQGDSLWFGSPTLLVSDSAYPMANETLYPFPYEQNLFNYKLSRARVVGVAIK